MPTSRFVVRGMTCGHCVAAVTAEVAVLPGVRSVDVDLASGAVVVDSDGPLVEDDLAAAVTEAGYELAR